jgi:hypothetical protein
MRIDGTPNLADVSAEGALRSRLDTAIISTSRGANTVKLVAGPRILSGYRLDLIFDAGVSGVVDFSYSKQARE